MRETVGDVVLAYEIDGPVAAPVVVLSHCFAADRHFWVDQLPALQDFRVLRNDVRGHGESSLPPRPFTLDVLADDVAGLLDALGLGTARVSVIKTFGTSWRVS